MKIIGKVDGKTVVEHNRFHDYQVCVRCKHICTRSCNSQVSHDPDIENKFKFGEDGEVEWNGTCLACGALPDYCGTWASDSRGK